MAVLLSPKVRRIGDDFEYDYGVHGIRLELTGITQNRQGFHARLTVWTGHGDPVKLVWCRLNLDSGTQRGALARDLTANFPEFDWATALGQVSDMTFAAWQEGSPTVRLVDVAAPPKPQYLVDPLLPLNETTILYGDSDAGKSLALDTPIATPSGWTTMGELKVGDQVFDERGEPCCVIAATPILLRRECYRITFTGGESIVADANHEWLVRNAYGGQAQNKISIRTTAEIAPFFRVRESDGVGAARYSIDVAQPLQCPEADLPIDPYVLGAWLGDGDSAGPAITVGHTDRQIVTEIELAGYPVYAPPGSVRETTSKYHIGLSRGDRTHCRNGHLYSLEPVRSKGGTRVCLECAADSRRFGPATPLLVGHGAGAQLSDHLRALNLLGNKHIPAMYLRASEKQRLALLQGLMDTDGSIDVRKGSSACEFTTTLSAGFAEQVADLIRTLGMKPTVSVGRASIGDRYIGPKWRVYFIAWADLPVFRLERKVSRLWPFTSIDRSGRRHILNVEKSMSVPVRCIQVDSPSHLYLVGRTLIATHNSTISMWLALCVALGLEAPGFTLPRRGPVLYLDWETNPETHKRRADRIAAGIGVALSPDIHYRQVLRPLADEVRTIQHEVSRLGAVLVVVDSLGFCTGTGGESINDSSVATTAMNALRTLGVTRLALHHMSHESVKSPGTGSAPGGSRYYRNAARCLWEIRRSVVSPQMANVGLYNRKMNDDARREDPLAWEIDYGDTRGGPIRFSKCDLEDDPGLRANMSLADQLAYLLREGAMSVPQLADEVDATSEGIRKTLRGAGRFVQVSGTPMWGLRAPRSTPDSASWVAR